MQLNLFDGVTYDAQRDGNRLAAQLDAVRRLMADECWRSLATIATRTGYPEASVSARLRDLRKPRHGSRTVERNHLGNGLWVYRLLK